MRRNRRKYPAAVAWLLCIGSKIRNRYESAQAIWEAMDGEKPYGATLEKLASYFGWKLHYKTRSYLVKRRHRK